MIQRVTEASHTDTSATPTFDFTVSAGDDRALLVLVATGDGNAGSAQVVSSVTYDDQPLTPVGAAANSNRIRVEAWVLLNPPVTTASIVVTLAASAESGIVAVSYTGVGQAGTPATTSGASPNPTVNVSSAADELVVDVLGYVNQGSAPQPGTGQTLIGRALYSSSTDWIGASEEAGAATVTMSWTGANRLFALLAVPLKPAGGGPPPTFRPEWALRSTITLQPGRAA